MVHEVGAEFLNRLGFLHRRSGVDTHIRGVRRIRILLTLVLLLPLNQAQSNSASVPNLETEIRREKVWR